MHRNRLALLQFRNPNLVASVQAMQCLLASPLNTPHWTAFSINFLFHFSSTSEGLCMLILAAFLQSQANYPYFREKEAKDQDV